MLLLPKVSRSVHGPQSDDVEGRFQAAIPQKQVPWSVLTSVRRTLGSLLLALLYAAFATATRHVDALPFVLISSSRFTVLPVTQRERERDWTHRAHQLSIFP